MTKHILIIGFVWPEPKSSAAGTRMMQLIHAFQAQAYHITFACSASPSAHAFDLKTLQIEHVQIKINDTSFDDFVKKLNPQIVVFDRFMTEEQFGWRVAEYCPDALRILDTEDLHSLRKVRQECYKAKQEFTVEKWLQADITKREIASIYRCDLSLIISKFEMQWLQKVLQLDSDLLLYLPFMIPQMSDAQLAALPKFEDRHHFITIGSFRHEPNYDSVLYLKETIWPLVKRGLPEAEMHVYGSYPMQKVTQLENAKVGFLIKGWANNVKAVMQEARVCLAPLRFGAGLKGKFIDAMQHGTPSVTTHIGAEGLKESFGGFVEDDPQAIAENAIKLYKDASIWQVKQDAGFKMLTSFNTTAIRQKLTERIYASMENLEINRQKNFIGTLLRHHSLQSTKYMSKWIEEKNKK